MRYQSIVSRTVFFLFVCLCIFGSTKRLNAHTAFHAFDVSNSTVIKGEDYSHKVSKNPIIEPISPPQPRNKRGDFVCTSNRYIQDERQIGLVSWYGGAFDGQKTASGERFNKNADTIAHLTLPMGTEVLVENSETGATHKARVNDCGPFVEGRIADLSYGLAKRLGLTNTGKARAIITVL